MSGEADRAAEARKADVESARLRGDVLRLVIEIKDKWFDQRHGPETSLAGAHTLISLDDLEGIIMSGMVRFSAEWKKPFPPRHPSGALMFFAHNDYGFVESCRSVLVRKLAAGELRATGRDARDPLKSTEIPAAVWNLLVADFDRSSAGCGEISFADVRVSAAAPSMSSAMDPAAANSRDTPQQKRAIQKR